MRNNMLNEGEPLRFITIPTATDTGNGAPTFSRLRASELKGVLGSTPGTLSRLQVGAPIPRLARAWALVGCLACGGLVQGASFTGLGLRPGNPALPVHRHQRAGAAAAVLPAAVALSLNATASAK